MLAYFFMNNWFHCLSSDWVVLIDIWVLLNWLNSSWFQCFFSPSQNFESNPYFEETRLTKSFSFHDEGTTEITSTPINWKEGMVNSVISWQVMSKSCTLFCLLFNCISKMWRVYQMESVMKRKGTRGFGLMKGLFSQPVYFFSCYLTLKPVIML